MSGMPKIKHELAVKMRKSGMTMSSIADRFGVTKAAVYHNLHRQVARRNVVRQVRTCACGCGQVHKRRKYATVECYYRKLRRESGYVEWRHGKRIGRAVVEGLFPLTSKHVVHHVNGDERDNRVENLWVFAHNGDHISHHRGGNALPIWRGDRQPPVEVLAVVLGRLAS